MQRDQVLPRHARRQIGAEILALLLHAPRTVADLCQLLGTDEDAVKPALARLRRSLGALVVGRRLVPTGGVPACVWGAVGAAYVPGVRERLAAQYQADAAALAASKAQRERDKCARYRERQRAKRRSAPRYLGEVVGPPYVTGYRWSLGRGIGGRD